MGPHGDKPFSNGHATSSEIQQLVQSTRDLITLVSTQILGDDPGSLQSRVIASQEKTERRFQEIEERAFGDNPTSLRSRQTEQEKDTAVSRGRLALTWGFIGGAGVFLGLKLQTIAGWFGFVPKSHTLPMIFYGKVAQFDAVIGKCWNATSTVIVCAWPRAVFLMRKFWG